MGFIAPAAPPVDIEEWKQLPHLERIKPLAQDWAVNGVGAPFQADAEVAIPDGLIVPVLRGVDQMGLKEIRLRSEDLIKRARAQKLKQDESRGATFTISNLGMFGVDAFTAIIIQPQAAILAVGAIVDRVVPVGVGPDARPGIRPMMTLTLSSDHRVVDGARAAAFMGDVIAAIRNPQQYFNGPGASD